MVSKLRFVLFLFIFITICHSFPKFKIRMPRLKITHLEKCGPDNKKYVNLSVVLNNVDSEGWKSLDMDMELIQPFKDYYFSMVVHKLNNGDWQQNIYTEEGKACYAFKRSLKRGIEKLGNEMEPKFKDMCNIDKGNYSVRNFEVPQSGHNFPPLPGTLQGILNFMNEKKENVCCLKIIAEYSA